MGVREGHAGKGRRKGRGRKRIVEVTEGNWMTSDTEKQIEINNRTKQCMVIYSSKTRRLAIILSTFKGRSGWLNGLGLIL
jgi:hypothetical protein